MIRKISTQHTGGDYLYSKHKHSVKSIVKCGIKKHTAHHTIVSECYAM